MFRYVFVLILSLTIVFPTAAQQRTNRDQNNNDQTRQTREDRTRGGDNTNQNEVSPVRRIRRGSPNSDGGNPQPPGRPGFRAIDGRNNNLQNPLVGATGIQLIRLSAAAYADGVSALDDTRANPRDVSNAICAQEGSRPNAQNVTDFLWQWGQFLDHDLDLTDGVDPAEPHNINIPTGDVFFDPQNTGNQTMSFNRSIYDTDSGRSTLNPRQQINEITAWIDASNVYGSESERAEALRAHDGSGKLKVSEGNFLPFNTDGLPNAGGDSAELFLAGDVRANEQLGLTVMHTLFVREHNRLAEAYAQANPDWDGDRIYEQARKIVGAQMQVITYNEFLPALLGRNNMLEPYRGYRDNIDASIANEFSTGAYRFGHSAVNATLLRLDADGNAVPQGHLSLRNAFFAPYRLAETGLAPILRGLAAQRCQSVDPLVIDDLRNFLFGPPGSGGFDLASLNIQRGRDHGLGTFNDMRRAMGMPPARNWRDITSDAVMRQKLASVYDSVDDVDVWIGCLAEDPLPGAMVGPLAAEVIKDQFRALRDGDRFWYQNHLNRDEIRRVENTTLADIIRRNTTVGDELQDDVFHMPN